MVTCHAVQYAAALLFGCTRMLTCAMMTKANGSRPDMCSLHVSHHLDACKRDEVNDRLLDDHAVLKRAGLGADEMVGRLLPAKCAVMTEMLSRPTKLSCLHCKEQVTSLLGNVLRMQTALCVGHDLPAGGDVAAGRDRQPVPLPHHGLCAAIPHAGGTAAVRLHRRHQFDGGVGRQWHSKPGAAAAAAAACGTPRLVGGRARAGDAGPAAGCMPLRPGQLTYCILCEHACMYRCNNSLDLRLTSDACICPTVVLNITSYRRLL